MEEKKNHHPPDLATQLMAVSKTAASLVTCVCVVCLSAMFGVIRFSVCVYCGTLEQLCSNSIRI